MLLFVLLQAVLLVFFKWDPLLFLARTSMVGFAAAVAAAAATIVVGALDYGLATLKKFSFSDLFKGVGNPKMVSHVAVYPPLFVVGNLPDAYGSIAFLFCVALFMFPGLILFFPFFFCLTRRLQVHSSINKPRLFNRALITGYSIAFFFNLAFSVLGVAVFWSGEMGVSSIIVNSLPVSTAGLIQEVV